jgi:hypothetical protein
MKHSSSNVHAYGAVTAAKNITDGIENIHGYLYGYQGRVRRQTLFLHVRSTNRQYCTHDDFAEEKPITSMMASMPEPIAEIIEP